VIKAEVNLNHIREEMLQEKGLNGVVESLPEELRMLKIDITFDDNLESGQIDVDDYFHLANGYASPHINLTS
jgi:hypothetical protein